MSRELKVTAPAKVNLHLGVHPVTDERGYHRVDSVMCAVDLHDELIISPSDRLRVEMEPPVDLPMEQNSVFRAADALVRVLDRDARFSIRIVKRIPICSGLGGPSTDAAAAIMALCRVWEVPPTDERVVEVARAIGADVPFFLYGKPSYLAGAGDVLTESFPDAPRMPVVIVRPQGDGVSAGAAYRRFDAYPQAVPDIQPILDALRAGNTDEICQRTSNNLGPASCGLKPAITTVLSWLSAQDGVRCSLVSGSGSASFAITKTAEQAAAIARNASDLHGWWSYAGSTENSGPIVSFL